MKYSYIRNDFDTEHDFYWYLQQDGSRKLPGIGGVFNAVNLDVYHYAGQNPVKFSDPDGNAHIEEYNGYYSYRADDRFEKTIKAAYGWVPIIGSWMYDALNNITGKKNLGKNEIGKKIGGTVLDVVSQYGKSSGASDFAKSIGKKAGFLGFILNSVDSIKALTDNIDKVEIAIERLNLLQGSDKGFIEAVSPFVEQAMAKLIKEGDVKVDGIDWGGFANTLCQNPDKVNALRKSINDLKVLWDRRKEK